MAKKKKAIPHDKRLKRVARLQAARHWLATYQGKHIVRGYRKHFAVDLLCAIDELRMLGVKIDPGYIAAVKNSIAERARHKADKQRSNERAINEDSDENFAYIAGYTANGFAYGITWEELDSELSDADSIITTRPLEEG